MERDWDDGSGSAGASSWADAWEAGEPAGSAFAAASPALRPHPAPPPLAGIERRLASLATQAWAASEGGYVGGFDVNSVLIADPAGLALVEEVGDTIASQFGVVPGMALARRSGLAGELAAACDLIALSPRPLPFETSLAGKGGALLLVRGIALPIAVGADAGKVQAILNWREVLNRAATRRLRMELGAALAMAGRPAAGRPDPFAWPSGAAAAAAPWH